VQGKEGCDHEATPGKPGGTLQQKKKQDSIQSMEGNIHQVMPNRIQSKEFTVESMGNPREGMPIGFLRLLLCAKCPNKGIPTQAGPHVLIGSYVVFVIEVDEAVGSDASIN